MERAGRGFVSRRLTMITLVNSLAQGLGVNGGTSSPLNTSGSNFLVAIITAQQGTPQLISDSLGNTWTALTEYSNAGITSIRMFYAQNPTVGNAQTFTDRLVANSFSAIFVMAFSGMLTSGVFQAGTDSGANQFASLQTIQPGSITPAQSPALIITGDTAFGTSDNTGIYSIDSGFSAPITVPFLAGNWLGGAMSYLVQLVAAAVNPTWTNTDTGSVYQATDIAAFAGSSGVTDNLPWDKQSSFEDVIHA